MRGRTENDTYHVLLRNGERHEFRFKGVAAADLHRLDEIVSAYYDRAIDDIDHLIE